MPKKFTIEEIKSFLTLENGCWRGSAKELMESLETEEMVPQHDYRRGFDVCSDWPDTFNEYPAAQEELFSWAVLGREKIIQIEELARQYMVDANRITKFRFNDNKIVWVNMSFRPFGTSYWLISDGIKFKADGHIFVNQTKYETSGLDIRELGSRIWNLHSDGVMISYDVVSVMSDVVK